ncbi:uncharacterized protein LTR77_002013 [Saxophila tyrrhenica]|uniref:Myb-like domain-containing protein n=1 Tax=Saxophila tyrrhenica TaxID=1690608 RepID=A0AAV9PHC0_9PEZI|nr:hypothetical protein LTR77_002013 [Saxophila tyrrhenica]
MAEPPDDASATKRHLALTLLVELPFPLNKSLDQSLLRINAANAKILSIETRPTHSSSQLARPTSRQQSQSQLAFPHAAQTAQSPPALATAGSIPTPDTAAAAAAAKAPGNKTPTSAQRPRDPHTSTVRPATRPPRQHTQALTQQPQLDAEAEDPIEDEDDAILNNIADDDFPDDISIIQGTQPQPRPQVQPQTQQQTQPQPQARPPQRRSGTAFEVMARSRSQQNRKPTGNWSVEEDKILLHGIRLNWTSTQFIGAFKINRTPSAVRGRKAWLVRRYPNGVVPAGDERHGSVENASTAVPPSSNTRLNWALDEVRVLKKALGEGYDAPEIVERRFPNRSLESVTKKAGRVEEAVMRHERATADFPQDDSAVEGWGDSANLKLRRAVREKLSKKEAHTAYFRLFAKRDFQRKWNAYKAQLNGTAPLARPERQDGTAVQGNKGTQQTVDQSTPPSAQIPTSSLSTAQQSSPTRRPVNRPENLTAILPADASTNPSATPSARPSTRPSTNAETNPTPNAPDARANAQASDEMDIVQVAETGQTEQAISESHQDAQASDEMEIVQNKSTAHAVVRGQPQMRGQPLIRTLTQVPQLAPPEEWPELAVGAVDRRNMVLVGRWPHTTSVHIETLLQQGDVVLMKRAVEQSAAQGCPEDAQEDFDMGKLSVRQLYALSCGDEDERKRLYERQRRMIRESRIRHDRPGPRRQKIDYVERPDGHGGVILVQETFSETDTEAEMWEDMYDGPDSEVADDDVEEEEEEEEDGEDAGQQSVSGANVASGGKLCKAKAMTFTSGRILPSQIDDTYEVYDDNGNLVDVRYKQQVSDALVVDVEAATDAEADVDLDLPTAPPMEEVEGFVNDTVAPTDEQLQDLTQSGDVQMFDEDRTFMGTRQHAAARQSPEVRSSPMTAAEQSAFTAVAETSTPAVLGLDSLDQDEASRDGAQATAATDDTPTKKRSQRKRTHSTSEGAGTATSSDPEDGNTADDESPRRRKKIKTELISSPAKPRQQRDAIQQQRLADQLAMPPPPLPTSAVSEEKAQRNAERRARKKANRKAARESTAERSDPISVEHHEGLGNRERRRRRMPPISSDAPGSDAPARRTNVETRSHASRRRTTPRTTAIVQSIEAPEARPKRRIPQQDRTPGNKSGNADQGLGLGPDWYKANPIQTSPLKPKYVPPSPVKLPYDNDASSLPSTMQSSIVT